MVKNLSPTSAPRPAPFPVGAFVHYLGPTRSSYLQHGDVKEIVRVRPGVRGTGRQLHDEDGPMVYEDTGEPILSETKDAYSVWVYTDDKGHEQGRIIWPENADEWERVA